MACLYASSLGSANSIYTLDINHNPTLDFFFFYLWMFGREKILSGTMNICPHSLTWHWIFRNGKWRRPFLKANLSLWHRKERRAKEALYSFVRLVWQGCRVQSNSRPRCLLERQRKWQRWNYHAFLFAPSVSCLQSLQIINRYKPLCTNSFSNDVALLWCATYTHLNSADWLSVLLTGVK